MATRELLHAEIEQLDEATLSELYQIVKRFVASKSEPRKPGLMTKLKSIQIEAPEDFAANLDLYLGGEQEIEDDVH